MDATDNQINISPLFWQLADKLLRLRHLLDIQVVLLPDCLQNFVNLITNLLLALLDLPSDLFEQHIVQLAELLLQALL